MQHIGEGGDFGFYLDNEAKKANVQHAVFCWGSTLNQASAVHIQALYSADGILPGSSSKLRLLVINLASVPDSWLIPQLHKGLERCTPL